MRTVTIRKLTGQETGRRSRTGRSMSCMRAFRPLDAYLGRCGVNTPLLARLIQAHDPPRHVLWIRGPSRGVLSNQSYMAPLATGSSAPGALVSFCLGRLGDRLVKGRSGQF